MNRHRNRGVNVIWSKLFSFALAVASACFWLAGVEGVALVLLLFSVWFELWWNLPPINRDL